ncbi:hypothetical protein PAXINDRAFT_179925 [Paxillus involutus ATCC 200175]|nr:hypothetical protein PAXINDRAFT_179925 [Paxillus involutus ATCC 200175]
MQNIQEGNNAHSKKSTLRKRKEMDEETNKEAGHLNRSNESHSIDILPSNHGGGAHRRQHRKGFRSRGEPQEIQGTLPKNRVRASRFNGPHVGDRRRLKVKGETRMEKPQYAIPGARPPTASRKGA